jgi:RsiW-degrading membrane proteinase PrsW (M82 family)
MTVENIYVVFSLLVLFVIAGMFVLGNRYKKDKMPSPLAGLASAFIVAGIFFGNNRIIGFSLLAVGVILAVGDIIVKARRGRVR